MNKDQYFDLIKSYKYIANKSLGQNFLVNLSVAEKIVDSLDISENDNILEIGAGLGSLSYFLTKSNAKTTLIDVDERMVNFLNEHFSNYENITIKRQNILKDDVSKYTKIIGNLPYYITTGILEYLLLNATNAKRITLMTQKEVYFKLIDKNNISPLTLLLRYVCSVSNQTLVGKSNFVPIPHVDSSYFYLDTNENIKDVRNKDVYLLMKKIFIHKRKNILNCLTTIVKDKGFASKILLELKTNENARPEQLDIIFFFNLLKVLTDNNVVIK